MALSENLRTARESKGYSLEDVASRANVERQTIWKYEHEIMIPNAVVAVNIAEALGTTVEKLVKGKAENFLCEKTNN